MNLFLGMLWLLGGIGMLVYESVTGDVRWRIRGLNISSAWLLLMLALYNFVRWYGSRAPTAEENALQIAHEERLREVRHRDRSAAPDPTFDFTSQPTVPLPEPGRGDRPGEGRPPAEGPPSPN